MKKLLILAAAAWLAAAGMSGATQVAAAPQAPAADGGGVVAETDSVSLAFATIMGVYLRPDLERQFPLDEATIAEFVRGMAHAFEIKDVDAPFHAGVRNGLAMIDRVEAMQAMGMPITGRSFADALGVVLADRSPYTPEQADALLRRTIEAANPYRPLEAANPEEQQAFLNAQAAREGVIATPSGLLFEVLTEGEGAGPTASDQVSVTYTGRLADGTVFDSTEQPIRFPVSGLVPGFTEGLMMMKPGGEYRIFIPASLGYGSEGAADVIPPGAALDFTVRLLDVIR